MGRREFTAVRLAPAGRRAVAELAARETGGNMSEMIRKLLGEALAAREEKARGQ